LVPGNPANSVGEKGVKQRETPFKNRPTEKKALDTKKKKGPAKRWNLRKIFKTKKQRE